jgi:hypothetical protein
MKKGGGPKPRRPFCGGKKSASSLDRRYLQIATDLAHQQIVSVLCGAELSKAYLLLG